MRRRVRIDPLTSGKHLSDDGTPPVGYQMPWRAFRNMTLGDLEAVYVYFTNVPRRTGTNDKATPHNAQWCAVDADCTIATLGGTKCIVATHECTGATCATDGDCSACQVCTATKCAAPASSSACLSSGM